MRSASLVLFFTAALSMAQQGAAPRPSIVEGKVVNSITGETLRKSEVTLSTTLISEEVEAAMAKLGVDPDGGTPDTPKAARKTFSVTTDAAGKFRFEAPAGDYFLTAKHAAFLDATYKPEGKFAVNKKLHLTAGDELTGVSIRLAPHGAVSGRVIDEDGDPIAGASVTAQVYNYSGNGKRKLMPLDFDHTNDRGEFRLGKLAAGHYYIAADSAMVNPMAEAPAAPADGSPEMGYVITYYPKATDITLAASVDVAAGADLSGFVIPLQKSRVARIKGKLQGPDGVPMKNAQLMLLPAGNAASMHMKMVSDPQGRFEIANLQPGTYTLMITQMTGATPTLHMQPLTIPAEGLSNLQLGAQTDGSVQGTVVLAGDGKVSFKNLSVALKGDDYTPMMPVYAAVSETGAFTLNQVGQAPYVVGIQALPAGAYLKSVQWSGREMLGRPVDFEAGFTGNLQVVLGTDGGQVEVTVSRDDKPVGSATVVLLPADPSARLEENTKDEESDASGHATFNDVPPGSYLVLAWEKVDEGAWFDPALVKALETHAVKVAVGVKGHEKAAVGVIGAK
jgi:hypothetical protein